MRVKQAVPSGVPATTTTATSNPLLADSAGFSGQTPPGTVKKILVPVDFSECSVSALEYALSIAQPLGASLILLHIVEPAVHGLGYMSVGQGLDEANQNLIEARRDRLKTWCHKHVQHAISAESLVRMGRAPSEISDTARAYGADLVVLGSHGESLPKPGGLGSTADRVIRHAPCPVLVVPAELHGCH